MRGIGGWIAIRERSSVLACGEKGLPPWDFWIGLTFELQVVTGNLPDGVKGHHEKRSFILGRLTGLVAGGLIQEGLLKGRS